MIKTGSIYEAETLKAGAGVRILVTHYWPRGVKKGAIDLWLKELGTEPDLITVWKSGSIGWEDFSKRYIAGLKRAEALAALATLRGAVNKAGGRVTLLCTCKEQKRCHRRLLKELIEKE